MHFRCVQVMSSDAILSLLPRNKEDLLSGFKNKQMLDDSLLEMLDYCCTAFYNGDYVSASVLCKPVLDYTWEKLNTGYWKDVDINWRYVYTIGSAVLSICKYLTKSDDPCEDFFKDLMKTVDTGILMGAPVLDNVLDRLMHAFNDIYKEFTKTKQLSKRKLSTENKGEDEKIKKNKSECKNEKYHVDSDREIKRCCPSLETFQSQYLTSHTPVILTGLMEHWPAMTGERSWNLERIRSLAGHRLVPIEIGSKYTENNWTQSLMTVGEFIDKFIENFSEDFPTGYLAQHQLFDQVPEMKEDIIIPDYCYLGSEEEVDINAWFGPQGTVSPLHQDPKENFLSQVFGEKYVRLYSTEFTKSVYPHDTMLLKNTSQVDIENPDHVQFPLFKDACYSECILKPGEMLYIPKEYWHFVKSLSISFSVSFWWQ